MSERLGQPLSVYSRPLVIYFSPLVICSCCLIDALRTCLFKCFINMTIYLVSFFFAHFATIFSWELRVLFLDMFFKLFCCKCLRTCDTHNFFYVMGILKGGKKKGRMKLLLMQILKYFTGINNIFWQHQRIVEIKILNCYNTHFSWMLTNNNT